MLLSTVHKSNPLTSGGAVFAGSLEGTPGNTNATGSNARFSAPSKIVADSTGNFYVSDTSNHTIRKITRFGEVTTVFGTGSSGSSLTTLNSPRALALDFSNNLYISDFSNNRILSISNGHTLGSNATLIASGLKDIEEIAVNSNGSQMLFKTNSTFGVNLIQYRNGTVDGIVNTSQNDGVPNVASVAYNSDGQFYYSTTAGQSLNYQISAFKMNLNPPTTYVISVTSVTQEAAMYPASAQIGIDPVAAGFSVGQSFTLSGFSSELVNGYIGTISALNVGGASNIQFNYTGDLEAFRLGVPNREATLNYSSTDPKGGNSRVLGLAWDTIPTVTGDGTDSPGSVLRMNYFLTDSEFDFPDYPYTAGANQSYTGTTIYAKNFLGDFAIYGQPPYTFITSASVYDFQYDVGIQLSNVEENRGGSTTSPSFIHAINLGGGFNVPGPAGFSPLNGFILGPNIEPGTTITAYTPGAPNLITTNKAFFAVPAEIINFNLEPIGDRSATNEFSYTNLPIGANLLIGMKLTGPGAGASRIVEVIPNFADPTQGIIKTDANVLIPEGNTLEHGATGKYVFGPWIGGSKRLLSVTFAPITFPSGIGAGTLTATIINNNPTSVMIDGVFYGTFLKNMQFSRLDSILLYANLQGPYGIRQYANVEGSFVLNDENQEIPNINQFALFPTTSEIIAVVPQPTTNNLEIYQNEY